MYKCEFKRKESPHNWVCGEGATWRSASAEGIKIRIFQRNNLKQAFLEEKKPGFLNIVVRMLLT